MKSTTVLIAGMSLCISASVASAGFHNVSFGSGNDNSNMLAGAEPNINQIYNALAGTNLSLADLNAGMGNRIDDFGAAFTDRRFVDGSQNVQITGVWWGGNSISDPDGNAQHDFGIRTQGGIDVDIFNNIDGPVAPTPVNFDQLLIDNGSAAGEWFNFFAVRPGDATEIAYSDESLNSGQQHRVATFDISFLAGSTIDVPWLGTDVEIGALDPGKSHFLLFFDTGGDNDHNDFVVIVENLALVPLPQPAALAGIGILGLCSIRRRRDA